MNKNDYPRACDYYWAKILNILSYMFMICFFFFIVKDIIPLYIALTGISIVITVLNFDFVFFHNKISPRKKNLKQSLIAGILNVTFWIMLFMFSKEFYFLMMNSTFLEGLLLLLMVVIMVCVFIFNCVFFVCIVYVLFSKFFAKFKLKYLKFKRKRCKLNPEYKRNE